MKHDVAVFTPYVFHVGQKIRIDSGRRKGDWEIAVIGEHTITLKCPISKKQYEWASFCFLVEDVRGEIWPQDS